MLPAPVYSPAPAGQQPQYQPQQQMRFGGPLQSANYPKTEMAPPNQRQVGFKNLLADCFSASTNQFIR